MSKEWHISAHLHFEQDEKIKSKHLRTFYQLEYYESIKIIINKHLPSQFFFYWKGRSDFEWLMLL